LAPSTANRSLTGGAIAGIVVGAVAAFSLLFGIVLYYLRRRSHKAANAGLPVGQDVDQTAKYEKPELDSTAMQRHELSGGPEMSEAQGHMDPVEMPGHYGGLETRELDALPAEHR
jgi:hypothetical protein